MLGTGSSDGATTKLNGFMAGGETRHVMAILRRKNATNH
jgi:hypothetical protein